MFNLLNLAKEAFSDVIYCQERSSQWWLHESWSKVLFTNGKHEMGWPTDQSNNSCFCKYFWWWWIASLYWPATGRNKQLNGEPYIQYTSMFILKWSSDLWHFICRILVANLRNQCCSCQGLCMASRRVTRCGHKNAPHVQIIWFVGQKKCYVNRNLAIRQRQKLIVSG